MTTMIGSLLCRLMGVVPAIDLQVSKQEARAVKQRLHDAETELANLKASLEAVWITEWKTTKDGKRRYRKVARKMVVNRWTTESEEL